ncbi:hypothetical protein C8J57DRAFT_1492756 [Mycena rebaudengoi]|nr:hypothetical protein C8J57DRAFT_1492756 [Mycena rebaudengoi]
MKACANTTTSPRTRPITTTPPRAPPSHTQRDAQSNIKLYLPSPQRGVQPYANAPTSPGNYGSGGARGGGYAPASAYGSAYRGAGKYRKKALGPTPSSPPLKESWDWTKHKVYGVNLGGWFVLEPCVGSGSHSWASRLPGVARPTRWLGVRTSRCGYYRNYALCAVTWWANQGARCVERSTCCDVELRPTEPRLRLFEDAYTYARRNRRVAFWSLACCNALGRGLPRDVTPYLARPPHGAHTPHAWCTCCACYDVLQGLTEDAQTGGLACRSRRATLAEALASNVALAARLNSACSGMGKLGRNTYSAWEAKQGPEERGAHLHSIHY